MKKSLLALLILLLGVIGITPVQAAVYVFEPQPRDLNDLYHRVSYTWGIDSDMMQGNILNASISFSNINDYIDESDDILWVNLLNSAPLGVHTTDVYGVATNAFNNQILSGNAHLIGTYSDADGNYGAQTPGSNISFDIPTGYYSWLTDGNFGFGIDPDCVFYNDGVKVTVRTDAPVPEPTSMMLLGMGILGLFGLKRKV